jgi:hypothetical protein
LLERILHDSSGLLVKENAATLFHDQQGLGIPGTISDVRNPEFGWALEFGRRNGFARLNRYGIFGFGFWLVGSERMNDQAKKGGKR